MGVSVIEVLSIPDMCRDELVRARAKFEQIPLFCRNC